MLIVSQLCSFSLIMQRSNKYHHSHWFDVTREATNTVIVIGLMQPELVTTIYHTRGEYPNHYTTDVVV